MAGGGGRRRQVLSLVSAHARPRDAYALAVREHAEDGPLIGFARLALGGQQAGQIGFALRPDRWGQGYGTELVNAPLDPGFTDLRLHRLRAARAPGNTASHAVLTRRDMTEEGRIRHHVHVRGAWRDSIIHSRPAHDTPPT